MATGTFLLEVRITPNPSAFVTDISKAAEFRGFEVLLADGYFDIGRGSLPTVLIMRAATREAAHAFLDELNRRSRSTWDFSVETGNILTENSATRMSVGLPPSEQ